MRTTKRAIILVATVLLTLMTLTACNYEDEVAYDWVRIPKGFVRLDMTKGICPSNCFDVQFLNDCDIEAEYSTNGDSGFLAHMDRNNELTPIKTGRHRTQVEQDEKLYVSNYLQQTPLFAMEQSFLSIIFFENEEPIGYTLIYVAVFEIEGNQVTREMMKDATPDTEQTYTFYLGKVIHSVKFGKGSDVTVDQIKDRINSMEIKYLLGLR